MREGQGGFAHDQTRTDTFRMAFLTPIVGAFVVICNLSFFEALNWLNIEIKYKCQWIILINATIKCLKSQVYFVEYRCANFSSMFPSKVLLFWQESISLPIPTETFQIKGKQRHFSHFAYGKILVLNLQALGTHIFFIQKVYFIHHISKVI